MSPSVGDPLAERVVESRTIHRGRYLEFRIDTIERADGSRGTRDVVGHPGAVAVLALDDQRRLLLVRQWRSPAGRALLEIPAGTLDHDPSTGRAEDPDATARRELEEETGYRADTWRRIMSFWTAPGFASEVMHLYLATGLVPVHEDRLGPDEDERLEVHHVALEEAMVRLDHGEIADAKTIVALLWLDRHRDSGQLPGAVGAAGSTGPVQNTASTSPIVAEVSFTPLELALANGAWLRSQRATVLFGILFGLAAVIAALVGGDLFVVLPGAVFALLLLTGLFPVPFVWWQMRRKAGFLHMTMRFDERGIETDGPLGHGLMPWSAIAQVRTAPPYMFLKTEGGLVVLGRTDALGPGELDQVQRLALRYGLLLNGSRATPPGT